MTDKNNTVVKEKTDGPQNAAASGKKNVKIRKERRKPGDNPTDDKKKNKQKVSKVLVNNLRMIAKIWKMTPEFIYTITLEGVVWGLINSVEIIFVNRMFNAFDENPHFGYVAIIIGSLLLFYLFAYLFDGFYWERYIPVVKQKLELKIHRELFEKAQAADLVSYDDPAYFNDFVWAMDEAQNKAIAVTDTVRKIINRIVASCAILTVLFTIDIWIAVILLGSSLILIFISLAGNRLNFRLEKEKQPLNRKRQYVNRVYHLSDCAKELRTSHVHDNMCNIYDSNFDSQVELERGYNVKFFFIWGLGWNIVRSVSNYGTQIYMFLKLVSGQVLLGGFTAAVNATWRLRWMLTDLIEQFTKFPEYSLFIDKYLTFLSNSPKILPGTRIPGEFESLEIKNLSFTYGFGESRDAKDGNKLVLEDINLSIRRGEKIALVGYNGAGKTSLIKLIMRLYEPTEGQILYNGIDIREYDTTLYRERIGAVFQDYKIFAASVAENVLCGEFTEDKRETVERALDAVSFTDRLNSLPQGLDTHLTREFNDKGINLSGGESQKIAIARVFTGAAELYIMDEPSSALDPLAEYKLNHAILEYAKNKTVIFISHRLSTTRMADCIYMFDNGRLIECGTHDELQAQDGKYAEMFRIQAQKYTENLSA